MSRHRTVIAGHRGASGLVPHENTVEALVRTAEIGARWVEVDVRRLADGTLVLLHDATVDRRPIAGMTLSELRERVAPTGLNVPTLSEALAACRRTGLSVDLELKEPGTEGAVAEIARAMLDPDRYVYTSFHAETVQRLQHLDRHARRGLLLGRPQVLASLTARVRELFPIELLRSCAADFAVPHWRLVQLGVLGRLRAAGYPVWVWTVNDPDGLGWLLEQDVQGVITDRPDIAVALRRKHEAHNGEEPLPGEVAIA